MALTDLQLAQAIDKIAYVYSDLALATLSYDTSDEHLINMVVPGDLFALNASDAAAGYLLQTIGKAVDSWANQQVNWIQAGVKPDGTPYSFDQWMAYADQQLIPTIESSGAPNVDIWSNFSLLTRGIFSDGSDVAKKIANTSAQIAQGLGALAQTAIDLSDKAIKKLGGAENTAYFIALILGGLVLYKILKD